MEDSYYKATKSRTARHQNKTTTFDRSIGSFYELIPDILGSVQKPASDEILRRLHESTRYDRDAEWRFRTRYEGGNGSRKEYDEEIMKSFLLDDDEQLAGERGFLEHSSSSGRWRKELDDGWRGKERNRDCANGNCVKSDVSLSRSRLFYGYPEEDAIEKIGRRNYIRERCVKNGGVYGPEAVAAVGGLGFTKSTIMGGSARNPTFPAEDVYDGNPGSLLWTSSCKTRSGQKKWDSGAMSSIVNSPRNHNKLYGSKASPIGSLQCESRHNIPIMTNNTPTPKQLDETDNSKIPSESAVIPSNCKKDIPPKNFYLPKKLINLQTKNASGVGKVNVEIGVPFRRPPVQHGRMKMPRRNTKRKKGRSIKRNKSVSKNDRPKDSRHRGPKIEGINWKLNSEVFGEGEQPKIRTVVLPFPQKKYRHLM